LNSLQRLNPKTGMLEPVAASTFASLNLTERGDIEEWVKANPSVLLPHTGEELLLVASEFDGFDKTNERLDVLAMDKAGRLVVIELKRDTSFTTAHMQALGYAAYLSGFKFDDLVSVYGQYARRVGRTATDDEFGQELLDFIEVEFEGSDWDPDPRIVIAARVFRPEVLATCQWLRRKFDIDISCVQMSPYELGEEILVHVNTVLPLPDEHMYRMNRKTVTPVADKLTKSRTRAPKNESWWRSENGNASPAFFAVLSSIERWLVGEGFHLETNWTAQSYVGYWSGSRCVIAAWPQKAGAAIYLPDPSADGTSENASTFFGEVSAKLSAVDHKVSWAPTYNALANPIRLVLKPNSMAIPELATAMGQSLAQYRPGQPSEDAVEPTA